MSPKYRSFQYRLLQRALVTNVQLCKWGIKESEKCDFCKEEKETVVHLLCECTQVLPLWERIFKFIEETYKEGVTANDKGSIITNSICEKKNGIGNLICLITKQYIYRQKCLGECLSYHGLVAVVKQLQNIEKYIATKNDKVTKHTKKWYPQEYMPQ